MCGRFTLRTPAGVLIRHFELDASGPWQLPLFEPRYNISPTQEIAVVRQLAESGRRDASLLRWGLIPSWSKEPAAGPPLITARAETLADKPSFRTPFRRRRCLIPADGFFEWQQPPGGGRGQKQPFYIHRPDAQPFALAGLWETWTQPADADRSDAEPRVLESCTIVTTTANRALGEIH